MKSISTSLLIAAFAATLGATACNSENEKSYTATVGWNISGQSTCQAILVAPGATDPQTVTLEKMVVTVYEDEEYKTALNIEDTRITVGETDCSDYTIELDELPRGTYWVTVEAYAQREGDSKAYPYYSGERQLKVPATDGATTNVTLTVGKGDVRVRWGFDFLDKCGVDATVKVSLDAGSIINDYSTNELVDCAQENIFVAGRSWDTYELTLEAYDADNKLTHAGTCVDSAKQDIGEFELHPGEVYECEVFLHKI